MTGGELRRIAIVGGGIASLTAAETLRREGFDGDLTIIGDEPHAPYSRPALSKAALLDDEATVKTFKRKDGQVWLLPHNSLYSPIDGNYAQIMGKVVAVMRRL